MKRKWQRVLSWILTLTMLLGTFQGTGFSVFAGDDEDVIISENDSELVGDPSASDDDLDDPADEEEIVGAVGIISLSETDENTEWGTWNADSKLLLLNKMDGIAKTNALKWQVDGAATTNIDDWDLVDAENHSVFNTDAAGKTWFHGMNVEVLEDAINGQYLAIYGTPTVDLPEATYTLVNDTVDAVYDMTICIGSNMHVYTKAYDSFYTVNKTWGYYTDNSYSYDINYEPGFGDPAKNTPDEFVFTIGDGTITKGDLQFKATNGKRADDTSFDDTKEQKNITWELYEADEDDYEINASTGAKTFNDDALLVRVNAGENGDFNGLTFENTAGVLTIRGKATKTFTTSIKDGDEADGQPKICILRAVNNDIEGTAAYTVKNGEENILIQINSINNGVIDPRHLGWEEPKLTASYWDMYAEGADVKTAVADVTPDTWYAYEKSVQPGYTIDTNPGNQKVVPISFKLVNHNENNIDLTNVTAALEDLEEDNPNYEENGAANFDLSATELGTLTSGENNEASFTVAPKPALEARGLVYAARVVVYADQLPVQGIELGRVYFNVNNGFTLTDGENQPIKLNLLGEEDGVKFYTFDAGTYTAGNPLPEMRINLIGSDENLDPKFEGTGEGKEGVDVQEFLPGLDPLTYNRDYVIFKGDIDAEAWFDLTDENAPVNGIPVDNDQVDPVPGTEYVMYSVPLVAFDKAESRAIFFAQFTVKPADLDLTLNGDEVKNADTFKWHATEDSYDVDAKTGVSTADRTFVISNPNEQDMELWVELDDEGYDTVGDHDPEDYVNIFEFANGKDSYPEDIEAGTDAQLQKLTVSAKSTASIVIRPYTELEGAIAAPYAGTIKVYGLNDQNTWPAYEESKIYKDKVLLQTINLNFTVIPDDAHLIVEPDDDNNPDDGSNVYENRRNITVGVGEEFSWPLKYEGGFEDDYTSVKWDLVKAGVNTTPGEKAGNADQTNYVYDGTGLKRWGFQFSSTGVLSTIGATIDTSAEAEGNNFFTICVSAEYGDGKFVYSYYEITVEPTDKAIVLTGQGKTLKATVEYNGEGIITGGDVKNEMDHIEDTVAQIATGRNLVLETSNDTIEPSFTTITLENRSKVTMKDVVLSMESLYKVDGGALENNTRNPFAGITYGTESWDWTNHIIALGDIESLAQLRFNVDIKALHFNDVEEGDYVALLKVSGADMKDQYVVIILHVYDAPTLGKLTEKYDADGIEIVPETSATIITNYHDVPEDLAALLSRGNNPSVAHAFVATTDNTIAGAKVKLGEALDLQLVARDEATHTLIRGKVEYTWAPTIPGVDAGVTDNKSESGFSLSTDGKITGVAEKPGTYYLTVHVKDTRDECTAEGHNEIKITDGYADICIYVPGAVQLGLTTKDNKNVLNEEEWIGEGLWIFDGVVAGSVIDEEAAKEIIVRNKSNDTVAEGLKVELKDVTASAKLAGSAAHFEAELSAETIPANKTIKLTIKPSSDNVVAGWYEANVVITGSNVEPVTFPVRWLVSRKLTVTAPDQSKTLTRTGTKDYALEFEAAGAGIAYDINNNLLDNDEAWWEAVSGLDSEYYQNVYWALRIKNDDGDDKALARLAEALHEMGFNNVEGDILDVEFTENNTKPDTYKRGIEKNLINEQDVIYIALKELRDDSRFNDLKSTLLTGGGNWSFTAVAIVEPVYDDVAPNPGSEVKVLPEQYTEMDVTLQVIPTSDVYVVYDKDTTVQGIKLYDTYSGNSTTEIVSKHKNLVALKADDDWTKDIDDYKKVTSFAFRDYAEGSYVPGTASTSRTFVLKSELANVPLFAEAKVVSEDKVTPSTYFDIEVVDMTGVDGKVNKTGAAAYDYEAYTVTVHEKLKASTTPYTGYLIISGIGFENIEIPLSVTISPKNYDIAVFGNVNMDAVNDHLTTITEEGFTTAYVAVDPDDNDETAAVGYLTVFSTGNERIDVTRVEEVDSADADANVLGNKDRKLVLEELEPAVNVSGTPDVIDPARDVEAPLYTDSDYEHISIKVKSAKTVSSGSAYVRIWYTDKNSSSLESSKTVKVNYVVYADGISYTIDPFQQTAYQMGAAKVPEGYAVSDNVVTFTITNNDTHIGDESYALYNTSVTIDINKSNHYDLFTVNGSNTEDGTSFIPAKKIMPGESATFTVEPIEGLPAGNNAYIAEVTVKPVNAAAKEQDLSFNVVRNDDFTTYAFTEGYKMESGWNDRVQATLLQLAQANTEGFIVVGLNAGGQKLTPANQNQSTLKNGYLINLNSDENFAIEAENGWDVKVQLDANNILTVTKLATSNEGVYENKIVNPEYDAASGKHEFKSLTFNMLETVTYAFNTNWEDYYYTMGIGMEGGIIVDGVDYGPIDGLVFAEAFPNNTKAKNGFKFLVPYGKTLKEAKRIVGTTKAYSDPFVVLGGYSGNKSLDVFMDIEDHETIGKDNVIRLDRDLIPKYHTHEYYKEETVMVVEGDKEANGKPVVTWHWIGSEEEGYTGATVTLHCIDPLCNDYEGSAIVYDEKAVTVTPAKNPGSCTDGGFTSYKAEVTRPETNILYVSQNEALHLGEVNRHKYTFDWDDVRFYNRDDVKTAYAEVIKTCEADYHDVDRDGDPKVVVSSNKTEFFGTEPTCEEKGKGYYHFTFNDPDIPEADIAAGKNVVSTNSVEVDALGHKWACVSANWEGGSYAEKPKSASLNLVCQNDETHTYVLKVTADNISEERTDAAVTYKAIGYYDDQMVDASITFTSHTDHEWTVSFNWVTVSVNLVDTKVTATATCLTGGEKEELLVKVTEEVTGNLKTYTAKATDPAGKEWTESKTIDLKTGEEVDHEHVWSEPVWDWIGTTSENAVAKATFTCSVSGNHSVTLDATKIDVEKRTAKKITYKAYVTGPDDKEYTSTYVYDIESGSGKTSEENEIDIADGKYTVIGIEEEYYYTSVAIKPSFRIVDNERDVVLAKGVDYTVSYKDNKKLGANATVKIKGKGNYAGVDESIKFTIKDPKELVEGETLAAGKIKKVTVSEKSFTYNGKAQYPTTITVTMKDGKVFTFKHDGDGEYTNETEGDTTVALSFCNNKDKGTATVLVTGAEKSKKATYKIAAAEIGTATIEVEGATWGVKAEQAKVIATLGEDAIELIPGQDFKVSYKAKNAGENAGEAKITGKGNFKKSIKKSYNVEALELTEENIIITAAANKKAKVVVVDNAGNTVGKKLYSYELTDAEGNPVAAKAKLAAGTVTAKVTATGNVTGEATAEATVTTASISKVKVKVDKNFTKTYTGEQIKLDADDFGAGKIEVTGLTYGEDFEIVGYKNNIKKGSMTVTIQGIGEKCGTKTFKVKIAAKSLNK